MAGVGGRRNEVRGSQPEVLPFGSGVGGITMSLVGMIAPVTSPLPEYSSVAVSYSFAVGEICALTPGSNVRKNGKVNSCTFTLYPAFFNVSATYFADASYPGVPDARVPPFWLAIRCSTRSWARIPLTVTALRIFLVLT